MMRSGGGWPSGRIRFWVEIHLPRICADFHGYIAIDIRLLFAYTVIRQQSPCATGLKISLGLSFPQHPHRIHNPDADMVSNGI